MISIEPKQTTDGRNDGPSRQLTPEEKATITSQGFNGTHYVYYQGDEPVVAAAPIVEPPNWLGLEQSLRYSDEFNKAYALASDKGFNMITTTLINGKAGHSSENGLASAFQLLPIEYVNGEPKVLFTWTEQEKENINAALEANNFKYRLE